MPLLSERTVGKSGKAGIWNIAETMEELMKLAVLPQKELVALNKVSREHRKKEWLSARILVSHLIGKKSAKIYYDENNKPRLANSDYQLSLSHSHHLLAAITDKPETGIDIEIIQPKIERIKEKFMSAEELEAVGKKNSVEKLYVYWCAKESLYKLYGKKQLAFKENIYVEPFDFSRGGKIRGWIRNGFTNKFFSLWYEKISYQEKDFMLSHILNS